MWLLLCLCFFCQNVVAQTNRAQRFYNLALQHEARHQHKEARRKMESAIRLYPAYTAAYSTLGQWYVSDNNFQKAITTFRDASLKTKNGAKQFAFPLARCLTLGYQPEEALQTISAFGNNSKEWQMLKANALLMQREMANPLRDTAKLLPRINTYDAEMYPWLSEDGSQLYFTRRVNGADEDFFKTTKDTCGGWFTGTNLGSPPNSAAQESAQMISADAHYLFFTRCEIKSDNGWEGGGCDLYMAYRADAVWSTPQSFGATINTPAYEGTPCLSADNRELYFASDRPGGYGSTDIWMSRFEDGLWQEPRNLGPEINTAGTETAPYLHADNRTLFFSSTGHATLGGADIFRAMRSSDTGWNHMEHLGIPINTSANENSFCLSADGTQAFFASDRNGVQGDFDLYEIHLPEKLQPLPIVKIQGVVKDSLSGKRLPVSSIYITDAATHEALYHFNANRGDASFMITLPKGNRYQWHTTGMRFQSKDDTIAINSNDTNTILNLNIALLPQGYIAPVNDTLLLTIHFPLNSSKLTDTDKIQLQQAMIPWMEAANATILFVNGYTDNTGTPILNEQLSFSRARLITDALIDLGFEPVNINTQGWGEAAPIAPNDDEEGWQKNRRVEVILRR